MANLLKWHEMPNSLPTILSIKNLHVLQKFYRETINNAQKRNKVSAFVCILGQNLILLTIEITSDDCLWSCDLI